MTEQENEKNDKFWLYIGGLITVLLMIIAIVKHNEDAKFAPIQQLVDEEAKMMNIRVLK
jgi:hypothetical protein